MRKPTRVSRRRPLIAIVDDDGRVRESLGELLESAGYAVRAFSGSAELLAAGIGDVDCLLTDIGMPGLDGFELFDIVRRKRSELPVFLITARDDPDDMERAKASGVNGLFRKPFDVQRLLADISRTVNRSKGGSDVS
jgi:FixJ family two-component response regulator